MQKVLITLVMAAFVASAFAQSPPSAKPASGMAMPQPATMPSMPPSARPDPFKPNPVAPPPTAATSLPETAAILPEPPKTPTMGVGGDGRTFIGVVGNNKALYKTGDGYVYEQISNP